MHAWNSDFVQSGYEAAALGHITNIDGQGIRFHPPPLGNMIQKLVKEEAAPPNSKETLNRAKKMVKQQAEANTARKPALDAPEFGYMVHWLSELGKTSELDALLRYADERLHPTWENGGLFYPRHDELMNEDLEWTLMDPFTGNAAIGYARLNVADGQKKMYETPWTFEDLASRPWIDGVDLASGVDFLRGTWDYERSCLILTMRTWDGRKRKITTTIRNLSEGLWKVYENGEIIRESTLKQRGEMDLSLDVDGDELDVVLVREPPTVQYRA